MNSFKSISNMEANKIYTLLQLTDSGFPTGGFSHSLGLESFLQHYKQIDPVLLHQAFICILENSGSFAVPFVKASHMITVEANSSQKRLPSGDSTKGDKHMKQLMCDLDQICQAYLTNHVARKASIHQGKSLMEVSCYIFPDLPSDVKATLTDLPYCHQPVVFGYLLAALGLDIETTLTSFMFCVVRTLVATAVRLDVLGAMEGQKVQTKLQQLLPDILERNKSRTVAEACMKFPALDILQNCQDTLFCKLFYS